jgi:predicted glutamine amidotransferase
MRSEISLVAAPIVMLIVRSYPRMICTMCRLFAWHSPVPITPEVALGSDGAAFIELSHLHKDGWGLAWADHGIKRYRDEHPAFDAPTLDIASSTDGILHLRWATEAIPVCIPNTHPFVKSGPDGEIAFIHNGGIPRGEKLRSLIDDDLFNSLEGEGDSEQYFAAIISLMRKNGGSLLEAYKTFLAEVEVLKYSSLNAFLLTAESLYVICAHRKENRPTGQPDDYYALSWRVDESGIFTAWSSYVRKDSGTKIENYSMFEINRLTGEVSSHSLS